VVFDESLVPAYYSTTGKAPAIKVDNPLKLPIFRALQHYFILMQKKLANTFRASEKNVYRPHNSPIIYEPMCYI
jgi:hypothetical protein